MIKQNNAALETVSNKAFSLVKDVQTAIILIYRSLKTLI